jgi:tetratricopeptide (TPR) repeat protein/serine/threonine protein kinase
MATAPTAETIFSRAIEIASPGERAAFLEAACAGDAQLRDEVARLVGDHFRAGQFLEQPVAPMPETIGEPAGERPGTHIGPYKLVEQIGEGGMGTVWMAQQTKPVKRLVAVKLIKPGMDSKQVIARFEAERQALALMDHPNIARVLDGGTTDAGRPYFVMDLVKGVPITKYCDEHHLTPRQRLELFLPICQAVQHAHQKGIIHRDLKPSNVLVAQYDGRPVPKVIDFGVAKAAGQSLTEKTLVTGFGSIVGTLEYMSPEQAEVNQLDIDTRSDIYSMGVLLYELLTGGPPFTRKDLEKAGMAEMLRVIREQEPSKPSTKLSTAEGLPTLAANRGTEPAKLMKLVRGELDWIVMKALEKDRNRRYETANSFARDIERYLADEPVEACPPSAGYRLRKFARRNKGPVLAATTIVLVLVAGILGTTWGMLHAKAAARAEKQAKETAQQSEAETTAVLDFVETKVFAAARPKDQDGGQGYDVKLADAVKAALSFVDKSFTGQPLIEARLRMTMGLSFWYLGDSETASEQYQAARELYTEHRGLDHPDTLRSMARLANSYFTAGRNQEALKLYEETLRLSKAKLGPDHPDTLSHMGNLANSYGVAGRTQEAIQLQEEALRLQKGKLGPVHRDTLMSMHNLAVHFDDAGRMKEALELREETLQLRKAQLGPVHPDTLMSMHNLANSYLAAGRVEEAIKLHEETLRLRKANLGPNHPDTFRGMLSLATCYYAGGRRQSALKLREETLQLVKTKLGPDHDLTLLSMNNLAQSYLAAGHTQEPLGAILRDALTSRERRAKAQPGNSLEQERLAWTHGQMGEAKQAVHNYAAAVLAYARSVEMFEKLDQAGVLKDRYFRGRLDFYRQRLLLCRKAEKAMSLWYQRRPDEAIAELEQAIRLAPNLSLLHEDLGIICCDGKQDYDTAIREFKEAIRLDPRRATTHFNLGQAFREKGLIEDAIRAYEASIRLQPDNAVAHLNLGVVLKAKGEYAKAIAEFEQAIRCDPKDAGPHVNLGAYWCDVKHDYDRAIAEFREAIRLKPDESVAHFNLGIALSRKGLLERAAAEFEETIRLKLDYPKAHFELGLALRRQHKFAQAAAALREAIRLQPQDASTRNALGGALFDQGEFQEAEAVFQEAIRLQPKQGLYHSNRGNALRRLRRFGEADAEYREAARLQPENAEAHNQVAWFLVTCPDAKVRDPQRAIELAKKAVALAPKEGAFWNTLGAAHYRAGDWKLAVEALNKSMSLCKGGDSHDWFFLAMAHWQLGEKEQAHKWFDQGAEWMEINDPKNEDLRRFRGEAERLLGVNEKKM